MDEAIAHCSWVKGVWRAHRPRAVRREVESVDGDDLCADGEGQIGGPVESDRGLA